MRDKKELENEIMDLCEQAKCSEKDQKRHMRQYLRGWNPHPPQRFANWWITQHEYSQGISAETGFNCQIHRDAYIEAKSSGIA
jgi:hypothetical protein